MAEDVYQRLREQLNQYSVGFPTTESGIELKILRKMYTEEEASLFLDLTLALEAPEAVAQRTHRDPETVSKLLGEMAAKGLVFRLRKGSAVRYAAVPFVIGSYEFQLKNMDRELAEMVETYFNEGMLSKGLAGNVVPLRTVPVNRAVDVTRPVAPYEDAREILKGKKKIAVAECICRVQQGHLDQSCDKPNEVCFVFGAHADYYIENGLARPVSQEEALAILDASEKAGLVNQPANMINPGGMCNCCGDCCGILRALNELPKPAEMVVTNYFAAVDAELCNACETCIERCQMAAISIGDDEVAEIDLDRCIGCGLCVTTCPTEAMRMALKPEGERREPPASGRDLMIETSRKRGTTLVPGTMSEK